MGRMKDLAIDLENAGFDWQEEQARDWVELETIERLRMLEDLNLDFDIHFNEYSEYSEREFAEKERREIELLAEIQEYRTNGYM